MTLHNHTRDEALQTEVMFREVSLELKIVPISTPPLLGATIAEKGSSALFRENREDLLE